MKNISLQLAVLSIIFSSTVLSAQTTNSQSVGFPTNGTFDGTGIESVQANNGNLHIEIPLFTLPGRGLSVPVSYVYDSKGWYGKTTGDLVDIEPEKAPQGVRSNQGWRVSAPLADNSGIGFTILGTCGTSGSTFAYSYQESNGTSHPFPPLCQNLTGNTIYAVDGSGYAIQFGTLTKGIRKDGVATYYDSGSSLDVMEDTNGNKITQVDASPGSITDTLGRSVQTNFTLNSNTGKYELSYHDASGTAQKIVMTKSSVSVITHLCPFWTDFSVCHEYSNSNWQVPTEIDLPNGMKYLITYDSMNNSYGMPSSIQLPTGATISYTYGSTADQCQVGNGLTSFDLDDSGPRVTSRKVSVTGNPDANWTYSYSCGPNTQSSWVSQAVVTSPNLDDTVHKFAHLLDYGQSFLLDRTLPPSYETETDYYSGPKSGNVVLKSVQTVYQDKSVGPHLPISVTTTWPQQGNLVSRVETVWDTIADPLTQTWTGPWLPNLSWGNPTEKREYAFYTSGSGTQARKTDFNYLHLTTTAYKNLNIANRPTSKIVSDASGSPFAQTTYAYDGESALVQASGVTNHDYTNYPRTFRTRGNLTKTSVWRNLPLPITWLDTVHTHDELGNRVSTSDPKGNPTTFDYTDAWSDTSCALGTTKAFVTLTTAPATNTQHRSKAKYYPCTGQVQSTQDENDILANRTGTTYSYDLMLRPSTVNYPDGGQTSYSYADTSGSVSITSTQTINSGTNQVTVSSRDGLGREYKSQLTSDPDGTDTVDTTFDKLGRKASVSNPYRSGDTTYSTAYQYDALNRITLEIPPDGSISTNNVATSYGGQTTGALCLTTTVTDQASKSRKSCTDALGRLVEVFEDPSSLNYETDYGYDVLNNLISVTQKGDNATNARTRTFIYDSLSRLTSAANPESGTITYSYTNGTALCAGDISAVCSKTAPAPNQTSGTVTTSYTYDVLNRLTQKSYSDGTTLPALFGYDQSSVTIHTDQFNISNSIGRMSWECTATSTSCPTMSAFSYDPMGRVIGLWNSADGIVDPKFTYSYNLDGSPATLTYPSGRILTYTVKGAGRVTDIKDVANGVTYATSATYAPPGELAGAVYGTTSTGITITDSYNKRLQPFVFTVATNGSGTQTIFSRTYDFQLGTTDNGVVDKIMNGLDDNRTQNFTYDNLNRLLTACTKGSNWGETYTIDAWGNLTNIGAGTGAGCTGKVYHETLNAAPASTKNQLNGYAYDSAGNLTSDGTHSYVYDDENRLTSTAGYTYTYDAQGERVRKAGATPTVFYLHGPGGETLAETTSSGTLLEEYIFLNGQRIARRDAPSGAVHYYVADHLGSASVITDASGTVQKEADYYPYGGEIVISGSDPNHYKFTGKERDETGLDDFDARYYGSSLGRFMTADWGAIPMAVPYAVLGNPQTLNLYSYVENNPATGTDPDGHAGGNDINPFQGDASGLYDCLHSGGSCDGKDTQKTAAAVAGPVTTAPSTMEKIDQAVKPLVDSAEGALESTGSKVLSFVGGVVEDAAVPLMILLNPVQTGGPGDVPDHGHQSSSSPEPEAAAGGAGARQGGGTTESTITRPNPGRDGGTSSHIVEKDASGKTISVTHQVHVNGQLVHQHQTHVGKYGTRRQFPDSWVKNPEVNQ